LRAAEGRGQSSTGTCQGAGRQLEFHFHSAASGGSERYLLHLPRSYAVGISVWRLPQRKSLGRWDLSPAAKFRAVSDHRSVRRSAVRADFRQRAAGKRIRLQKHVLFRIAWAFTVRPTRRGAGELRNQRPDLEARRQADIKLGGNPPYAVRGPTFPPRRNIGVCFTRTR